MDTANSSAAYYHRDGRVIAVAPSEVNASILSERETEMNVNAHAKIILSYVAGSVVWFVLLGFLQATNDIIMACVGNYLALTVGLALGGYGQALIKRRPWLLVLVPNAPLVLGFFI